MKKMAHRADICIRTDSHSHTPFLVRDSIVAAAKEEGYSFAVDAPAGALNRPLDSTVEYDFDSIVAAERRR
jgi:hypothetical protein